MGRRLGGGCLRTERTEFTHLEEVVRRIALSRFDVAVSLYHNRRPVLRLPAARGREGEEQRVAQALGKAFMEHALALEFEAEGLHLRGWLGEPGYSRSQADQQYFYVNGRIVRDKLVTHAVSQAHRERLYPGRHPAYVLYLELDPAGVDVNVHPTKHEVRFREARRVHDFLFRSLHAALGDGEAEGIAEAGVPAYGPFAAAANRGAARSAAHGPTAPYSAEGDASGGGWADFVGLLGGGYMLGQNRGGLVMVDIAAARREIAHRRLEAAAAQGPIPARPLLVPATLAVDEGQAAAAERNGELLRRLGFDVSRVGPQALVVREAPVPLGAVAPEATLQRLLERLQTDAPEAEALLGVLAAEAALAPAPTPDEARALLRGLENLEPTVGSRVIAQVEYAELARYFRQ